MNQGMMKDLSGASAITIGLMVVVTLIGNVLVPEPPAPKGSPNAPAQTAAAPKATQATKASAGSAVNVPLPARLALADAKRGEAVAKKCTTCHGFDKGGKAKVGPNLWGVTGRVVGEGDFKFSDALKKVGGSWTFEKLDAYAANPKDFAPGNKMAFAGLANPAERADLLLYIRVQSDAPLALPQARPEDLAAAKAATAVAAAPAKPAVPQAEDPDLQGVAGVRPFERPRMAPALTAVFKDETWFKHALAGVSEPVPPSLAFLKDQEVWFNPFTRPGMPGPYDIRGWHGKK